MEVLKWHSTPLCVKYLVTSQGYYSTRKGKSKFLQSVSNLGDDVIPTSSSTDCTGAISIIENYDGPFQMEVEYYTIGEFLDSVSNL